MKKFQYIILAGLALSVVSCSKNALDKVNQDRNNAPGLQALNELPTVEVNSAVSLAGTELSWYSSVFIEHSAGTFGQMETADKRTTVTAASTFDNNWTSIYGNLTVLKDMITRCSANGTEPANTVTLGIAQILTAYNLAALTDMWGQVPWTDALQGNGVKQPKYDKQQFIYTSVLFNLLDSGILNIAKPVAADIKTKFGQQDMIYAGSVEKWTKAAYSLKARYFMRMQKVVPSAVDSALAAIPNGFGSNDDDFLFTQYQPGNQEVNGNPWWQFYEDRAYLSVSTTIYNLMNSRNDPRIPAYFAPIDDAGTIYPAPNGTAMESQGDIYSVGNYELNQVSPTPIMTYHELLFIKAEALARKGQDFKPTLQAAIESSFAYNAVDGADDYYNNQVVPLLGSDLQANLKEIMTQKYIADYEAESMEAYNDYRRTGFPAMNNPNNAAPYGFVQRFAYPTSEVTANPKNIPSVNVFTSPVWWAGGTE